MLSQEIKCFGDYRVKPAAAVGTNELIDSNDAKFTKIILFTTDKQQLIMVNISTMTWMRTLT
jgi:hypothetical protein